MAGVSLALAQCQAVTPVQYKHIFSGSDSDCCMLMLKVRIYVQNYNENQSHFYDCFFQHSTQHMSSATKNNSEKEGETLNQTECFQSHDGVVVTLTK